MFCKLRKFGLLGFKPRQKVLGLLCGNYIGGIFNSLVFNGFGHFEYLENKVFVELYRFFLKMQKFNRKVSQCLSQSFAKKKCKKKRFFSEILCEILLCVPLWLNSQKKHKKKPFLQGFTYFFRLLSDFSVIVYKSSISTSTSFIGNKPAVVWKRFSYSSIILRYSLTTNSSVSLFGSI